MTSFPGTGHASATSPSGESGSGLARNEAGGAARALGVVAGMMAQGPVRTDSTGGELPAPMAPASEGIADAPSYSAFTEPGANVPEAAAAGGDIGSGGQST